MTRVQRYVDHLPQGLASFPSCEAKASVLLKVKEYAARPLSGLPRPLQDLFDRPPPPSSWVSQCQTLALIVAMVEARGLPRAEESLWIRSAATHLFSSRMYQVLMRAATPGMVFRSANLRWSAFFRGTSLSSVVLTKQATVSLHAPEGLFNEDLAGIFVDVIHAAVNYTRDESAAAVITLAQHDRSTTRYQGSW